MDGPSFAVEYHRLFVFEKKHIGARRRRQLRDALIQSCRIGRKVSFLRLVATHCKGWNKRRTEQKDGKCEIECRSL